MSSFFCSYKQALTRYRTEACFLRGRGGHHTKMAAATSRCKFEGLSIKCQQPANSPGAIATIAGTNWNRLMQSRRIDSNLQAWIIKRLDNTRHMCCTYMPKSQRYFHVGINSHCTHFIPTTGSTFSIPLQVRTTVGQFIHCSAGVDTCQSLHIQAISFKFHFEKTKCGERVNLTNFSNVKAWNSDVPSGIFLVKQKYLLPKHKWNDSHDSNNINSFSFDP